MNAANAIKTIETTLKGDAVIVIGILHGARRTIGGFRFRDGQDHSETIVKTAAELFALACRKEGRKEAFRAVQDLVDVYG